MITIDERDDVKVPTPDANQVTLFYTDQALRFKDENGDVWTLTKQEDLDIIEEAKPKVYKALVTQSGLNAPIATVLENTLGNIVWSRIGAGEYLATLNGAFLANKTFLTFNNFSWEDNFDNTFKRYNDNQVRLFIAGGDDGVLNAESPAEIKIEVYP